MSSTAWKVNGANGVTLIQRVVNGETICRMSHGATHQEGYIVAAAPELLDEAKKQLDWLQHVMPQVQAPESVMMGFSQSIKAFKEVIEKAKGGAA